MYNGATPGLVESLVTRNHAPVQVGGIMKRGQMQLIRTTVVANPPDNIAPPA